MKKLLIGIDASRLEIDEKTGVEIYTAEIIKNIIRRSEHNFLLWGQSDKPHYLDQFKNRIKWKILSSSIFWTQARFAWELISHKSPDVIFIPSHVIPIIHKGRFVVTIHDLAFVHFPDIYSMSQRFYHNLAIKTALKSAKAIIAPSGATKDDLINYYHANPNLINVIPHGLDTDRFNQNKLEPSDLPFEIKKPYILFVGRLESKKNVETLIKAYQFIRQEDKINHQLVLVGKPGRGYEKIIEQINQLPANIKNDVIETDYVTDTTQTLLMKNADYFILPSLFEGFGMPILEAMACGVPVLASRTSSLVELVGDSGILFNPLKPFELAAALSRLIHHPGQRQDLIDAGINHVKKYTWTKSADLTLSVLEKIGNL